MIRLPLMMQTALGLTVAGLVIMAVPNFARAQASTALSSSTIGPICCRMFIEPSSAAVSLGKANLTVSPLIYREKTYVGDYQLKIVPYFFKSETGTLQFAAPVESVHKLLGGMPVKFAGKAVSAKDGKLKILIGKATPISNTKGSVTVSVITDNGLMVFNTFYHFGD